MIMQQLQGMSQNDLKAAKVLVVDDQTINVEIICSHLAPYYNVFKAYSGRDALEFCKKHHPDLVIMDVQMPEIDGLTACKKLKAHPELAHIPILFATTLSQTSDETKCWQAGGNDFLVKPVVAETLLNRVKSHLNFKFQADLLRKLAFIDGLTNIYNRRYYEDNLPHQLALARRTRQSVALLMIDIDYFKQYNDEYGHIQGDICLKSVAHGINNALQRPTDIVARYGGEEFVCVLPDTNKTGALHIAERICKAIYQLGINHVKSVHQRITVSIGTACSDEVGKNAGALVALADTHLYQAKQAGKNLCI